MFNISQIEIKKSLRAKSLRISVKSDGRIFLTHPAFISSEKALSFAESKSIWIERALLRHKEANLLPIPKSSKKDYEKFKKSAYDLVMTKINFFNKHYNFAFKTVKIKNQKTRWGSCSKSKNLNFSYRIIFLPEHLQDYLIVHELCHLQAFNHGQGFWSLVKEKIPTKDIVEFRQRVR